MAIKISVASAKRLGYSIKGYVIDKNTKTPIPVLEKAKKPKKRSKTKENRVELIDEGRICRLKKI